MLQRVRWARVRVGDDVVGEIGPGLLALVGVAAGDTPDDAALLARKTARLRVLAVDERPFERALVDVPGAARLCESQFALLGDLRRGTRPTWSGAAAPAAAEPLVETSAATSAA